MCIFSATRSARCWRQGDTVYAALDLGHFGAKLWRRDGAAGWRELAAPAFPPKPDDAADDPHPWSLGKIWVIEPGGVPGRLWAGTMPGGLFRSDDGGETWALNETLWRLPERRNWFGVAGGEQPGINSVLVDPRDPADIRVGVSTGGLWASRDGGASWQIINRGMYNEYMPPEQRETPIAQDIHRLARCAAHPDIVWCQHHNAVFRSEDSGATWRELTAIRRRNSALPSRRTRAIRKPRGSSRRRRTSAASRSTANSSSRAPATAARASRCCDAACRSAMPMIWCTATRSTSMPAARFWRSARHRRAVDLRRWRRSLDCGRCAPAAGRGRPFRRVCLDSEAAMQKITPFLWFDEQAEEAARFYTVNLQELTGDRDDAARQHPVRGRPGR